jgi:hypothetical protein
MTKAMWREYVSEADLLGASQVEISNFIQDRETSGSFDGYGWLDDNDTAIDPICRLVLSGVASYLEICGGDDPDELDQELTYALQAQDVIKDSEGYGTRFAILAQLFELAEDVIDYLVEFHFRKNGFNIQVELQSHLESTPGESDSSFAIFRLNHKRFVHLQSASTLISKPIPEGKKIWKVHNLSRTGELIHLKSRGNLPCIVCSEIGLIRVPSEVAEAVSKWQFNPTAENQRIAFRHLSASERETLISGTHEWCWNTFIPK